MKQKKPLLIVICLFGILTITSSCKHDAIKPTLLPLTASKNLKSKFDGIDEITQLTDYFAQTAGVDPSQIIYDTGSDTFTRYGTNDVVSHADLSNFLYYFLQNGGIVNTDTGGGGNCPTCPQPN